MKKLISNLKKLNALGVHWIDKENLQRKFTTTNSKGTDSKLLLLEISVYRNCSLVACLKCVQFHN